MAEDRDAWRHSIFNVAKELNKMEEMHKKTREAKGKLQLRQAPHRTLLSHVDTSHDPAFTT